MSAGFPVYTIDQIAPLLDRRGVIAVVRESLILHARGDVQSPMPGQLLFEDVRGDCHIKFGHLKGSPSFVVKVATGFSNNAALGLPSGNGLILLFDAQTGVPQCLFQDGGLMTAWRTAAATALAAHCLSPVSAPIVGIIGTGLQARLTPAWISELLPAAHYMMAGRVPARAAEAAATCASTSAASLEEVLSTADIVITATSSSTPLFAASHVRAGTHIVAIGADGPEKQELPTDLFARAAHVVCDDLLQCQQLGEYGKAIHAGAINPGSAVQIGALLDGDIVIARQPGDITIVDLTGVAAQDIAIANLFGAQLAFKSV